MSVLWRSSSSVRSILSNTFRRGARVSPKCRVISADLRNRLKNTHLPKRKRQNHPCSSSIRPNRLNLLQSRNLKNSVLTQSRVLPIVHSTSQEQLGLNRGEKIRQFGYLKQWIIQELTLRRARHTNSLKIWGQFHPNWEVPLWVIAYNKWIRSTIFLLQWA